MNPPELSQMRADGVAKAQRLLAQLERDRRAVADSAGVEKYDRAIAAAKAVLESLSSSKDSEDS